MKEDHAETGRISTDPYWWEGVKRHPAFGGSPARGYDVVVIGGGYTGLSAAIRLARSGASVAVLEAEQLGHGASTRNGGMVSGILKSSPATLARRAGHETARAIFGEAQSSVPHLENVIEQEGIDCDYSRCGMYFAAYTRRHLDAMRAERDELAAFGIQTRILSAQEGQGELASDYYHGGKLLEVAGGLQPAAYHRGLAAAATRNGAALFERARVTSLDRRAGGWRVTCGRGTVDASNVLVATNGYTNGGPWSFGRKLIPIRSYVMVTEALPAEKIRALIPRGRMIQDTKNLLYYFRPSPDGTRIVFGGRASFVEIDLAESARRLMQGLRQIFPEAMRNVRATHSWNGTVAFTFDRLPHIGQEDGLHYALGYCGQGVAMATYLGDRVAQAILSPGEPVSVFQDQRFSGRAGYTGNPWMLPAVSMGLKMRDFVDRHILG